MPYLRESDAGRIVVINGITAREPEGDMAPVSAARAALLNASRELTVELAPDGVCVNVVNLGAIVTDRQRARHAALAPDQPFDEWCAAERTGEACCSAGSAFRPTSLLSLASCSRR